MSYSAFYRENAGKDVEVVMTDGEVFSGKLFGYISEADNEPDPESIIVGDTELYTNEIKRLTVSG